MSNASAALRLVTLGTLSRRLRLAPAAVVGAVAYYPHGSASGGDACVAKCVIQKIDRRVTVFSTQFNLLVQRLPAEHLYTTEVEAWVYHVEQATKLRGSLRHNAAGIARALAQVNQFLAEHGPKPVVAPRPLKTTTSRFLAKRAEQRALHQYDAED